MSVAGGPDLIQNGLVLCLDAASTKSYPGSGTSWLDLNPTQSVTICGTTTENGTLTLTAPTGYVFASVDFASYGTPNGSCGSFTTSNCHSTTSYAYVASQLLGKTGSVSISATNGNFGDPCGGTPKRLYVQATAASSVAVLINGPTFSNDGNGSIVLDGIDDYIITNYSNNAPETTFELVVKPLNVSTGTSKVFLGKYKTSGQDYWIGLHPTDSSIIFNPNGSVLDSDVIPNTTSFYFITVTSTASERRIYVNGDFKKSAGASSVPSPNGRLCIGVYGEDLSFDTAFAISSLKIYERILSPTQIRQNYNAIKGRFRL